MSVTIYRLCVDGDMENVLYRIVIVELWNFRSLEHLSPGTFAPQHELSVIYTDFEKAFDKVPY